MLLANKTAVVYGGGGAIGGAAARVYAREGARVHLAGRRPAKLETSPGRSNADGGAADVALLDALDEAAVREHADTVATQTGGIDIALNAIGIPHVQGTPFAELSLDDYLHPITACCRTNFVTAQAVARHMVAQGSGVILTISTSGSRWPFPARWATAPRAQPSRRRPAFSPPSWGPAVPASSASCPTLIPEAGKQGSHSRAVFQPVAETLGLTVDEFLAAPADRSLLQRWPTLADVAEAAAFRQPPLPTMASSIPSSLAISAMRVPLSQTILDARARNSGSNFVLVTSIVT